MSHADRSAGAFLTFDSYGLACAFPLEAVQEIVPMAALFAPPGTPAGIAGFLDLRGRAIPILRLDLLFGLPEQKAGWHTPLIILRAGQTLVGILAECARQIVSGASQAWLPADPATVFHGCASATFEEAGRTTHVLDPERLLLEQERRLVAEFQAVAQQRLEFLEARC